MKQSLIEKKGIEYYMALPYSILLHDVEEEGKKYWIAEVPELPGCKSHGLSVEEAVESVEEAKRDWILDSLKSGEQVPTPIERESYSGRMLVRMSRSLHRSLALIAETEKLSLNQLIVTMLAKEVGRLSVLNRIEDKVENLLQKIDFILEEEGVNIPLTQSVMGIGESQESRQFLTLDVGLTPRNIGTAATSAVAAPGYVTTDPLTENLWQFNSFLRYPAQQRIICSYCKAGEENKVKNERK